MRQHERSRRSAGDGVRGGSGGARLPGMGDGPWAAEIPDKLYFRIGEVARLCGVAAHVLRFWEGEFPMLRPHKGGTGQRLFRQRDVEVALRIRRLLYDEGYTIVGARQLLRAESRTKEPAAAATDTAGTEREARLVELRDQMHELLEMLRQTPRAGRRERRAAAVVALPAHVEAPLFAWAQDDGAAVDEADADGTA